jgi:hypothetical protein
MNLKFLLVTGALFISILLVLLLIQAKANIEVQQAEQMLQVRPSEPKVFTQDMIKDLPEPVQRYFGHAITPGTLLTTSVKLTMRGQMRLSPDQAWMPLQAKESLSTRGFVWQATAGQGWLQMRGADYYTNGTGRMHFALWGLVPVINAQSPDIRRSAIGRWAGEYFWLPSALLPEQGVSWQAINPNTIQASLKADDEPITLTFVIDAQGRVLRSSLLRWGDKTADGRYAAIPFGGEYSAETTFGGYTIPSQMGAGWWFGTERYFEFFQVTLEQAQFH